MTGQVGDATGVNFDTMITRIDAATRSMNKLVTSVDNVMKKLGQLPDVNQTAGRAAAISSPANIPGTANGGNPNIPGDPGSAGTAMNKWMAALNFGRGAVNLTSALLPDAAQGVNRQQMRYDTSIQMGGMSPLNNARFRNQEVAINAAMAGRMANVQSAYQVSQVAATTSIVGANATSLASFAAAGFKNTGMDNATLAQAHARMATDPSSVNQSLAMGIRRHDSKGNYLTGDALYSQVYNRLGIAGKSAEQIQTQMASGRQIGNFLKNMGMSQEEQQAFQAYAMNKNANPSYTLAGDTTTSKESPRDSSAALVQEQSENIGDAMQANVDGYNQMNEVLTDATKKLGDFLEALGPAADALNHMAGMNVAFQNSGPAATAGRGIKDAGMGLLGGILASKAAKPLVNAFKSGGMRGGLGAIAKGGGKLAKVLRFGPGALFGLGTMAFEHVGRADGNVSNLDKAGSVLGNAATGAAMGAALGSILPGPGNVVGGILGGIGGIAGGILGWRGADKARKEMDLDPDEHVIDGQKVRIVPSKAIGDWNVNKNQLAKLHQNEMVLPADVAESFRTAVQNHVVSGSASKSGGGMVKVDVTLNNASWNEAQRLVKIVQEAVDTSRSLELLAST